MDERTNLLKLIRTWRTFYVLWFIGIAATLAQLITAPASWLHHGAAVVAALASFLVLGPLWATNLRPMTPEDRADVNRSARVATAGVLGWMTVAWAAPSLVDLPMLLAAAFLFVFGMSVIIAIVIVSHVAWRRWIPRPAAKIAA